MIFFTSENKTDLKAPAKGWGRGDRARGGARTDENKVGELSSQGTEPTPQLPILTLIRKDTDATPNTEQAPFPPRPLKGCPVTPARAHALQTPRPGLAPLLH